MDKRLLRNIACNELQHHKRDCRRNNELSLNYVFTRSQDLDDIYKRVIFSEAHRYNTETMSVFRFKAVAYAPNLVKLRVTKLRPSGLAANSANYCHCRNSAHAVHVLLAERTVTASCNKVKKTL